MRNDLSLMLHPACFPVPPPLNFWLFCGHFKVGAGRSSPGSPTAQNVQLSLGGGQPDSESLVAGEVILNDSKYFPESYNGILTPTIEL